MLEKRQKGFPERNSESYKANNKNNDNYIYIYIYIYTYIYIHTHTYIYVVCMCVHYYLETLSRPLLYLSITVIL